MTESTFFRFDVQSIFKKIDCTSNLEKVLSVIHTVNLKKLTVHRIRKISPSDFKTKIKGKIKRERAKTPKFRAGGGLKGKRIFNSIV